MSSPAGEGALPRALRIGLTGPIGCGKSTVGRWIEELGGTLVDADRLAHVVTAPGTPAAAAILAQFGDEVRGADGWVDRAALGRIVFADPQRLRALEAIVHPAVRPAILSAIERAEAGGARIVAIEAIRLVESGLAEACDEVWLVTCDPDEQVARLSDRGLERDDADRRIAAQSGIVERLRPHADRVLSTAGAAHAARRAVERALSDALGASRGAAGPT